MAFAILIAYGAAWFAFDRATFDWHAGAALATWMMTLFIQRVEHRDTQALHAKLDELLHAEGQIDNATTKLDESEPEDIKRHRERATADD